MSRISKTAFSVDQRKRMANNRRHSCLAHKEAKRHEKILSNYLSSNRVRQLKRDVQKANDKINELIDEWNDIVMENHRKRVKSDTWEEKNSYTSVDGELRLNYKDDPKSW